jgi:dienelactone hydrolase
LALLAAGGQHAGAGGPRVLPEGKLPEDSRLGPLKDLNGYFPMEVCASPEAWEARAAALKRQVLVGTGLWPMPAATPANPVIHGKIDRDTYTVERVYFESWPGFFVTGSLYRPKGATGKRPGVLCPHGHWNNGRFYDAGPDQVLRDIVNGAERFRVGGRFPLQARCVQLARMGCVVFHYDMIGYADSIQLEHRPGSREHMNTAENWGFFSPQAELRLQTMMGLQTYHSVRALDFMSSLPDVDPARIAVTGASGGGTQTFMICAIDPRPAVSFPAVMVSTAMQGGCTCENCSYLRVGTGNIELAALVSPRPLGMTAADDWTKEIATKGLPELAAHYKLLGVPDRVMAKALVQFPHNYNYVSREVMYHFVNKHLGLGLAEPIIEEDFSPLSIAELTVWDDAHPRPPKGDDVERALVKAMTEDSDRQLAALTPIDPSSLARYREVVGGAVQVMLGRELPPDGAVEQVSVAEHDRQGYLEFASLLRYKAKGEELPAVFLMPKNWNKEVVLWFHEEGKACLFDTGGQPRPQVQRLVDAGYAVGSCDLFGQGEFLAEGNAPAGGRLNQSGRDAWAGYAGYTYGYNHSLFSQRVHDVLSLLSFARHDEHHPSKIHLIGLSGAGPWVAAALAAAPGSFERAVVDTGGFRFATLDRLDHPHFLPGSVKYGDLPAFLALATSPGLLIMGEPEAPKIVRAVWTASGQTGEPAVRSVDDAEKEAAAVDWVINR